MEMRVGFYVFTAFSLVQFSHQMNVTSGNPCDFMTFLELGKFGIVNCSFGEPYYGIYWYSSSNNIPVIFYQDSVKKGTGYTSGEYDIYPNGSLKINTVSLHHETRFTVEYLSSLTGIPVEFEVDTTVYVEPSPTFPLINGCSNVTDSICFSQIQNQQLLCSLHEVRPNISLSWIKRTSSGDRVIPSDHFISPGHKWYTWHVSTLTKITNSSSLQLLVCKVEKPPGLLERDESLILVQNRDEDISTIEPTQRLVQLHTKLELSCAETRPMLIVWERSPKKSNTGREVLLWYGIAHGKHVSEVVYEDYSFGVSGNLEIKRTEVQHGGFYVCFSGDGIYDWVTKYQVDVYANPEPNHLIIDGCNPNQYCVLEVDRLGNLTCSVKGIYPEVELQLKPFYGDTIPLMKFTSNQLVSKREGNTFHVSLSSSYEIKDTSLEKITIICQVVGQNVKLFNLDTKFDLLLVNGK
ncbi:hypothetical protein HOLleu_04435 [Holothuria leucospilota]|uniref:Ig-like domain-containing protein n=1 Tax=Holothuria leucospilota TaxID=206669 RepID=A0A9Q1CU07_HOLLE|nr:hypothetical protein HOLleu_04435 [Holothuria leucospilota]